MSSWDNNYEVDDLFLNTGSKRWVLRITAQESFDTPYFSGLGFSVLLADIPGARLVDTSHRVDYDAPDDEPPFEAIDLWFGGTEWTPEAANLTDEEFEGFDLHALEREDVWGEVSGDAALERITSKVWTLDDLNKAIVEMGYPDLKLVISQTGAVVEESDHEVDYGGLEDAVRRTMRMVHVWGDLAAKYKKMRWTCSNADPEEDGELDQAMECESDFLQYAADAIINYGGIDEDDEAEARDRLDEMIMDADFGMLYILIVASDAGPDVAFDKFWVPIKGSAWERGNRYLSCEGLDEGDVHWFNQHLKLGEKFQVVTDFRDANGDTRLSGTYKVNDLDDVGGPVLLRMQSCHHTGISFFDMHLDDLRELMRAGGIALPGHSVDYETLSESWTAHVAGYDNTQIRNVLEVTFAVTGHESMHEVWKNGGSARGGLSGVFEPDGDSAFEEDGIMNVYKVAYDQDNFDELLEALPGVLKDLRVKFGTFTPENHPDRDEVRVVRVPITQLPYDDGPEEVNMSATNFGVILTVLGFEYGHEGTTIPAADLARRTQMYKPSDPYIDARVEQLSDLADWAQSNGHKDIYVA